jgi:hypothetical protein
MSTTTITTEIQKARYEVEALRDRIAANEEVWGPGCRPELRARLAVAEQELATAEARAEVARAAQAQSDFLSGLPVTLVRFSDAPGAKVHVEGSDGGPAVCGAYDRAHDDRGGRFAARTDAARALRHHNLCGRCRTSLQAWAR